MRGVEAEHRERAGHLGGSLWRASNASSPPGPALLLGAPAHTRAPGVDLGVVVAADEVGGLQVGHGAECTDGRSGAVSARSLTRMCRGVTVRVTVPSGRSGRSRRRRARARQAWTEPGGRTCCALPPRSPATSGRSRSSTSGRPGSALPWCGDLHRLHAGESGSRGSRRISASAESHRSKRALERRSPRPRAGSGPRAPGAGARAAAGRGSGSSAARRGAARPRWAGLRSDALGIRLARAAGGSPGSRVP